MWNDLADDAQLNPYLVCSCSLNSHKNIEWKARKEWMSIGSNKKKDDNEEEEGEKERKWDRR